MRSNLLLKRGRIAGLTRENWPAISRTGAGPGDNTKATGLCEIRRQQSPAWLDGLHGIDLQQAIAAALEVANWLKQSGTNAAPSENASATARICVHIRTINQYRRAFSANATATATRAAPRNS